MKFINLTRHTEIGANSYYLEAGGARLILDCGMHPKDAGDNALPNWKPIDGQTIDEAIILAWTENCDSTCWPTCGMVFLPV